jgi:subtilisin family serine protease
MNGNTALSTKGADIAASKGILVVSSAGNSGSNTWQKISAPADGDSVLSVGSVNNLGVYSSFSSKGPSADGRVKPDVCAIGEGTIIANHFGGFQSANGTSFSCPVLAGAAACLWQAFPEATNMEVSQAIKQSASQYITPDNLLGYGIPNFTNALFLITKTKYFPISETKVSNIFPSPFSNEFSVVYHSLDTENITIKIYDVSGNILFSRVYNATTNAQNIFVCNDLNELSAGIYILTLQNRKTKFTYKISKVK